MPSRDVFMFLLGSGCCAFALALLIGLIGFCWLLSPWHRDKWKTASSLAIRDAARRDVMMLEADIARLRRDRQELGLRTPARIASIAEEKQRLGLVK
jgi:hypothetical protein